MCVHKHSRSFCIECENIIGCTYNYCQDPDCDTVSLDLTNSSYPISICEICSSGGFKVVPCTLTGATNLDGVRDYYDKMGPCIKKELDKHEYPKSKKIQKRRAEMCIERPVEKGDFFDRKKWSVFKDPRK